MVLCAGISTCNLNFVTRFVSMLTFISLPPVFARNGWENYKETKYRSSYIESEDFKKYAGPEVDNGRQMSSVQ